MIYKGIDGCRYGWCVASGQGEDMTLSLVESVEQLASHGEHDEIIFIDMPIGLSDKTITRDLDMMARAYLPSPFRSSIFLTPCRAAVYADDYVTAKEINIKLSGKSISIQAWNICRRIKELDSYLRSTASAVPLYYEAHPEILFQALNGMAFTLKKKTAEGKALRLNILRSFIPNIDTMIEDFLSQHRRNQVQMDDVLDACCLFVSAQLWDRTSFIQTDVNIDSQGLPMRMPIILMQDHVSAHGQ